PSSGWGWGQCITSASANPASVPAIAWAFCPGLPASTSSACWRWSARGRYRIIGVCSHLCGFRRPFSSRIALPGGSTMKPRTLRWLSVLPLALGVIGGVGGQVPTTPYSGAPPLPPPPPFPVPTTPQANTPVYNPDAQYSDIVGLMGRVVSEQTELREQLPRL